MRRQIIAMTMAFVALPAAIVIAEPTRDGERIAAPPADSRATRPDGPLSTGKALQSFVLEPELRIELVAAEPLVDCPVAMAFDERGRSLPSSFSSSCSRTRSSKVACSCP